MAFQVDYDQAQQGFTLVKPGKYECVLTGVEGVTAKTGTKGYKLNVVIRDDVVQEFAGMTFEQVLWTRRDTGQVNGGLLNAMAKAMRLENGKSYNSIEDLFADMVLKPFVGEIIIDEQEYGPENKIWRSNRINRWEPSEKLNLNLAESKALQTDAGFYPIDNGDIPF